MPDETNSTPVPAENAVAPLGEAPTPVVPEVVTPPEPVPEQTPLSETPESVSETPVETPALSAQAPAPSEPTDMPSGAPEASATRDTSVVVEDTSVENVPLPEEVSTGTVELAGMAENPEGIRVGGEVAVGAGQGGGPDFAVVKSGVVGPSGDENLGTTAQSTPNEPLGNLQSVQTLSTGFVLGLFEKGRSAIQVRKRKKLERVMGLFAGQASITNDEVEKLLHVSDATATRYLSTLEQEGRVRQEGKTGHAVSYFKV